MALYDDTTFKVGTGHFYTAATSTAAPADFLAPSVSWSEIGHTSLDNIFSASSDGGDVTTLGTLQASTLRQSVSARTETWTFNIAQMDEASLKFYFGQNASYDDETNLLAVPNDPTPFTGAFLAVFIDGDDHFAFYAPKAEIKRGDDWSISDTSSLLTLPIAVTPLTVGSATSNYSVTPLLHPS